MEQVPNRIGRYVIENLVGVGGMGRIYKAHDPDIRRTVAIKLISTELMSSADRAEYIRRFRREAEAAARCAHPNIIAIYDFALHEGQPFLAMEFVYGMSLRQLLDERRIMAVPDAIHVMLQVLDGLASAHQQGVIHQDIKPANVMVTPEMKAKVADFGISRFANTEITSVSSSMGTPNYMSPEQCHGGTVDHRSDLFSAGATLFEMVAGERAFRGRSAVEVTHRIANERLALLPAAVRNAAPRLQFVLERAMGKQPEDRFESGSEMAEALRQILGGSVRSAPVAPDNTRLSTIEPPSPSVAPAAPPPPVAPPLAVPIGPPTGSAIPRTIDASILHVLEQKLTGYVGPIARIMVRDAAGHAGSVDALCSELALSVPEGAERERFRREVASLTGSRPLATDDAPSRGGSSRAVSEQELERVQQILTQYLGPIARVMVRRAGGEATSVESLWQLLSAHIESPAERAAFLRQRHG